MSFSLQQRHTYGAIMHNGAHCVISLCCQAARRCFCTTTVAAQVVSPRFTMPIAAPARASFRAVQSSQLEPQRRRACSSSFVVTGPASGTTVVSGDMQPGQTTRLHPRLLEAYRVRKAQRSVGSPGAEARANDPLTNNPPATSPVYHPSTDDTIIQEPNVVIVVDASGVLIDQYSLEAAVAVITAFGSAGVHITMSEVCKSMVMTPTRNLIHQLLCNADICAQWTAAHGDIPTHADFDELSATVTHLDTRLLDGVAGAMQRLGREKIQVIMQTTLRRSMIVALLDAMREQGAAPTVGRSSDDLETRCGPNVLWSQLESLMSPCDDIRDVIKVSADVEGMWEGYKAGAWTVGVYGKSRTMSEIERRPRYTQLCEGAHPNYLVQHFHQVPEVVDDIRKRRARGMTPDLCRNNTFIR